MKFKKYLSSFICFFIAALIGIGDSIIVAMNEKGVDFKVRLLFLLIAIIFVGFGEFFLVKTSPEKFKKLKYVFMVQEFGAIIILISALFQ